TRIDQGLRRQGGAQSARSQGTEAFDLWLPRPERRRQEHHHQAPARLTRPTGGTATVFGQDIIGDSTAIRQRAGYLAQDPRYYEDLTARQTMRFVAGFFYDGPRDRVEQRIEQTLELVGLEDKADRPITG